MFLYCKVNPKVTVAQMVQAGQSIPAVWPLESWLLGIKKLEFRQRMTVSSRSLADRVHSVLPVPTQIPIWLFDAVGHVAMLAIKSCDGPDCNIMLSSSINIHVGVKYEYEQLTNSNLRWFFIKPMSQLSWKSPLIASPHDVLDLKIGINKKESQVFRLTPERINTRQGTFIHSTLSYTEIPIKLINKEQMIPFLLETRLAGKLTMLGN